MNSMPATLSIRAELACALDGRPLSIHCADQRIVVEIPDVTTGLKLLQLGSPGGLQRQRFHDIKRLLDHLRFSLEVRVVGKTVANMGPGIGTRWWAFLGLPRVDLKPIRVLTLYLQG